MPTECERSVASPNELTIQHQQQQQQQQQQEHLELQQQQEQQQQQRHLSDIMESNGEMSTSQTSTTSSNGHNGSSSSNGGTGRKSSITSPDPTSYVAKARVTRPTPPPPSYNPMQFVQIKPCNLYQTAQEQLKKAEEVKKIKEIKKEEPEEWQNNLDNWKSSRRKRVEHIIDRVVEVKKLELEEHDRSRRKSKTFSEMIEERGDRPQRGRAKLASLAVYNEDESNDLSDLGIGTSSASGKSSLSEDYDNNSVLSDNAELDKAIFENNHKQNINTTREYISSPGYDTSSSTAPASSPDPCEYTYEGAIQDYKQRVSRATTGGSGRGGSANYTHNNNNNSSSSNNKIIKTLTTASKESTPERIVGAASNNGCTVTETYPTRRGSKIEDRLMGFEVTSPSDSQAEGVEKQKVDVPKIDISKRKEIFENQTANNEPKSLANGGGGVPKVMLRERFKFEASSSSTTAGSNSQAQENVKKEVKRLSGDITSIRDRLQSLEQQQNLVNSKNGATKSLASSSSSTTSSKLVDIPVPPLKERLSSLQNAVTKEEVRKPPVVLVDARQLEIMKNEEETAQQRKKQLEESTALTTAKSVLAQPIAAVQMEMPLIKVAEATEEVDRDDSGIHTSDDIDVVEEQLAKVQEQQLNAAIAALAMEEKQLEEAANAVNLIEAEFAELTSPVAPLPTKTGPTTAANATTTAATATTTAATATTTATTNEPPCEMEFSINEALELALDAIDKETKIAKKTNQKDDDTTNNLINDNTIAAINNQNDTQNKTDEEKELKSKLQTSKVNNDQDENEDDEEDEEVEVKISKEPIYENICSASTTKQMVDDAVEPIIIPNTNNNNKINNNISKSSNNNNLVELTNAFANQTITTTTTTTATIAATATKQEIAILTTTTAAAAATEKAATITAAMSSEQQQQQKQEPQQQQQQHQQQQQYQQQLHSTSDILPSQFTEEPEPYYQVPKSSEPYYDAPKHLRPIPVYENIEVFYTGLENSTLAAPQLGGAVGAFKMEPPKEKPPPPPTDSPPLFDDVDSVDNTDTWSSDNTYETITSHMAQNSLLAGEHPSPPIKRMNSTKRIKKELRNKRSSFLGIEGVSIDDDERYLELTVAPPPDMAQLLQEERRLEKQLYMKAGLCDSSDTGESRDSGVSENHSRQSSEHYTNSSEENERHVDSPSPTSSSSMRHIANSTNEMIYHSDSTTTTTSALLTAAQTPLLQTAKGNSAESWTESATAAAAATKSLTEATATANAKMHSIEEKIREQEEVLRVERELLQLEQEELKRQRENLMLRENMARRELQHGAKMLMSANRHSLQDLNGGAVFQPAMPLPQQPVASQQLPSQQIYANVPNLQHQYYHQVETDYRKSMSDLNEFSKRLMLPPTPPTKPMRAMHVTTTSAVLPNGHDEFAARQRHSLTHAQAYGGSLVKIATPNTASRGPGGHIYSNYHHQSAQNLTANIPNNMITNGHTAVHHGNMSRNTLHALSATPKPKYTDGWVQVQQRKSFDSNLANDPAWLSAYQQKRKSMPDAGANAASYHAYNNHWLVQEAEQRRVIAAVEQQHQQQRRSISTGNTPVHQQNGGGVSGGVGNVLSVVKNGNGKPLPDSIIQTLTERVQSKGIGDRKRFDNYNIDKSPLHAAAYHQQQQQQQQHHHHPPQQQSQLQPTIISSSVIHRHPASDANQSQLPQSATTAASTNVTSLTASQDKVLSVSGKKKCSHCGDELGRGAAMIIESLLLFYHINCFKCCVCHVQLGDGLNGTDVRVRNHKLHCQNCYSSDDGIKFSCV